MATYDVIARQVIRALNADSGNGFDAHSDSEMYPDRAIEHAVLNGEADVVHAILEAPVHARRAGSLTTSASLASGAQVPAHPGRLLGVVIDGIWAESMPVTEISRLLNPDRKRFDPLKLDSNEPFWALTGDNRLVFTGTSPATVYFGQYARPVFPTYENFLTGTMLAPDEYLPAVFFSAMQVIGHEGTQLGAMAAYYDRGKAQMAQIRGDSQPTLKVLQRAEQE